MSMESRTERGRRLLHLPLLQGVEFKPADYVFIASVLAKKRRSEYPDLNSIKSLYDLGIEASQEAIESRKRLEEAGHRELPEWEVTSDINSIRAIAGHVISTLTAISEN